MSTQIDNQQVEFFNKLTDALTREDIDEFRKTFLMLHPYDQAQYFLSLDSKQRFRLYTYLSPRETSFFFEHLELDEQKRYISEIDPSYASSMLAAMYVDNAVDNWKEAKTKATWQ